METIKISQDKLTFAADLLIKTRILGAFFSSTSDQRNVKQREIYS